MKHLLLAVLIMYSAVGRSQSGYYHKYIDFAHPENSQWEHLPAENLGTILLHAHLDGKLNAYQFDVEHQVTKWAPIPLSERREEWSPAREYYIDDMVYFNGKIYMTTADLTANSKRPDSSSYWVDQNIVGRAVSTLHRFPNLSDTTTKSYLLNRLIEEEPASYDPWNIDIEYNNNDRVIHNNTTYEAERDNIRMTEPGTNEKLWKVIVPHVQLFQPSDLTVIRILYNYRIKNGDTLHIPQMLSVMVTDPYKEVARNIGLNFYYNDVMSFLSNSSLPALHQSKMGYVGNGMFIFDSHTKMTFTKWLLEKIRSKEIKLDKKSIINDAEFNLLLGAREAELDHTAWYPVQNPRTLDITLVAGKLNTDFDYYTIPVLIITPKMMELPLKTLSITPSHDYKSILSKKFLHFVLDSVDMDSVEMLPLKPAPSVKKSGVIVYEFHFDYTDPGTDLYKIVTPLWSELAPAIEARKISMQPAPSLYPCNYNFKGTELKWSMGWRTIEEDFSLSIVLPPPGELPKKHMKIKEAGIVYVRKVDAGAGEKILNPHNL